LSARERQAIFELVSKGRGQAPFRLPAGVARWLIVGAGALAFLASGGREPALADVRAESAPTTVPIASAPRDEREEGSGDALVAEARDSLQSASKTARGAGEAAREEVHQVGESASAATELASSGRATATQALNAAGLVGGEPTTPSRLPHARDAPPGPLVRPRGNATQARWEDTIRASSRILVGSRSALTGVTGAGNRAGAPGPSPADGVAPAREWGEDPFRAAPDAASLQRAPAPGSERFTAVVLLWSATVTITGADLLRTHRNKPLFRAGKVLTPPG
jgi:hypothetical protein